MSGVQAGALPREREREGERERERERGREGERERERERDGKNDTQKTRVIKRGRIRFVLECGIQLIYR